MSLPQVMFGHLNVDVARSVVTLTNGVQELTQGALMKCETLVQSALGGSDVSERIEESTGSVEESAVGLAGYCSSLT